MYRLMCKHRKRLNVEGKQQPYVLFLFRLNFPSNFVEAFIAYENNVLCKEPFCLSILAFSNYLPTKKHWATTTTKMNEIKNHANCIDFSHIFTSWGGFRLIAHTPNQKWNIYIYVLNRTISVMCFHISIRVSNIYCDKRFFVVFWLQFIYLFHGIFYDLSLSLSLLSSANRQRKTHQRWFSSFRSHSHVHSLVIERHKIQMCTIHRNSFSFPFFFHSMHFILVSDNYRP